MSARWDRTRVMLMAIVLLNISTTLGCDTSKRIFDAFDSTRDTGLTIDRIWDIREPERKFLIVMVHGFNSSSEAAWGDSQAS